MSMAELMLVTTASSAPPVMKKISMAGERNLSATSARVLIWKNRGMGITPTQM